MGKILELIRGVVEGREQKRRNEDMPLKRRMVNRFFMITNVARFS